MGMHLFIDVETGGLNVDIHALLSLGAVFFDPETGEIGKMYYSAIRPDVSLGITVKALEVNGLTLEDIKGARSEREVWEESSKWLGSQRSAPMWSHNSEFDFKFLQAWESRCEEPLGSPRRNFFHCSRQLLMLAQLRGLYPAGESVSLQAAAKYYHLADDRFLKAHNALDDALLGALLVIRLYQEFGWSK